MEMASYVLAPIGAAALVAGVVVLAIEGRRGSRSPLSLIPALSSGTAGVLICGSF